jgi:hypothetical protein
MDEAMVTMKGTIRVGDEVHFRRRWGSGWVTVRSFNHENRWVNGTDRRGLARTIEVDSITAVKRHRKVKA